MGRLLGALLAALVVALPGSAVRAQAAEAVRPSFDCALAKGVIEATVCGDPKLAEADRVMARLYAAARTSAFGRGSSNQLPAQRDWLKERAGCLDTRVYKSRAECLGERYKGRNGELAVATLFSEPGLALDTLRQLDPEAAPLYELIVDYANTPAGANWPSLAKRAHLIQLLQPYFNNFKNDEQLGFGKDILADEGIKEPADALKSGKQFAQFLQVTSAYLRTDPIPRRFPCAAIVKHPELLDVEGPVFGSTLDNFIFDADCWTTLPPLPALDRLVKRINESWPNCDGTIRFSAYRFYGLAHDKAKVAGAAEINEFERSGAARQAIRIPRLRGVPPALANAAITGLSSYYQTHQNVDAKAANAFAASMVHEIMAAGHGCG